MTCNLGAVRVQRDNKKQNTFVPSNAPTSAFFTKYPSVACQGKIALRAPALSLFLALPSIPRTRVPPCVCMMRDAFVLPRRPSPPTVHSLHLRRDHHRPIPSSHVHLSTYKQHNLHAHGNPHDLPISRAPATSHSALAPSATEHMFQYGNMKPLSSRAPFRPIRFSFPTDATRCPCACATCREASH